MLPAFLSYAADDIEEVRTQATKQYLQEQGLISGYLTGSSVGGNAPMMTMQSTIGSGIGKPLFFAALQNSSAGHAVFASMPIILLILAISGGARQGEESDLVRYGLLMVGLVAIVIVLTAMVLVFYC
ncbi:hypothetical protein [Solimicrobium silvestre]|uniref:L-lactate permease n=1 Tax=Solimicrobium silvestre TaxID=2099400 RepID=A0A2S9H2M1_9BURK|nr:hypothetical protein [Solimicrobium silvestre]PRC94210.1 hypothetical protein S2091_0831 [Solimicrobium silvestre]